MVPSCLTPVSWMANAEEYCLMGCTGQLEEVCLVLIGFCIKDSSLAGTFAGSKNWLIPRGAVFLQPEMFLRYKNITIYYAICTI